MMVFLVLNNRLCVPNDKDLKRDILEEPCNYVYDMPPGNTKMYPTLKDNYWWKGMNQKIENLYPYA